jgi:hypothetical protein
VSAFPIDARSNFHTSSGRNKVAYSYSSSHHTFSAASRFRPFDW